MKTLIGALCAWVLLVSVADAAVYMKLGDIKGETVSAPETATLQISSETTATSDAGGVDSTTGTEAKKGSVDVNWKVEEAQKAGPALLEIDTIKGESPDTKGKESGEKGGTEDMNIGVGELQGGKVNKVDSFTIKQSVAESEGKREYVTQYKESDWDFLKRGSGSKGGISIATGDVNGLTEEEKQALLAAKKEHAEVQSGQDLEHFAKGVLMDNKAMEQISFNYEKISVKHRSSGKLFGFIPLSFTQEVAVETQGDEVGKVKVKMPWFSFLMKSDVSPEEIESEATAVVSENLGNNDNWNFGEYAEVLSSVSNILKTKHDTAKNSIGNIR